MALHVGEALEEYQILLGPLDEVVPALDDPINPGMTVQVARVSTEDITYEVPIEYKVQRQYTTQLPVGTNRVTREGAEGKESQRWQVTFRDGVEVLRQLIGKEVLVAPTDQILLCGNGATVSRSGDHRYSGAVSMLATGYTHTGNRTASGVYPYYGAVAVDTSRISFGTELYVEGYGYAKALDRGGAIKGNRIDLFFETRGEALRWGKRWVNVYILE
jgi:3D (Asp-Asp-Asp) domain-containing protein